MKTKITAILLFVGLIKCFSQSFVVPQANSYNIYKALYAAGLSSSPYDTVNVKFKVLPNGDIYFKSGAPQPGYVWTATDTTGLGSWQAAGGGGGYWSLTNGRLYPTNPTDSLTIGINTATAPVTVATRMDLSGGPINIVAPIHALLTADFALDTAITYVLSRNDTFQKLSIDQYGIGISAQSNAGVSRMIASNTGALLFNFLPGDGNVGIGLTNAEYKFDVYGPSGIPAFRVRQNGLPILQTGSGMYADISIGDYTYDWNGTYLQVQDSLQQIIMPRGKVGIGTNTPTSTLTVDGTFTTNNGEWSLFNGNTNANKIYSSTDAIYIGDSGRGQLIMDYNYQSTGENVLYTAISGVVEEGIKFNFNDQEYKYGLASDAPGDGAYMLAKYSGPSYLSYVMGGTEAMRITGAGYVGIGTTTPSTPLHVEGNVLLNGLVGIGTVSAAAVLDVNSTTSGVLLPRVTTTERDAFSGPANGMIIYNTTTDKFQGYAGGSWVDLN